MDCTRRCTCFSYGIPNNSTRESYRERRSCNPPRRSSILHKLGSYARTCSKHSADRCNTVGEQRAENLDLPYSNGGYIKESGCGASRRGCRSAARNAARRQHETCLPWSVGASNPHGQRTHHEVDRSNHDAKKQIILTSSLQQFVLEAAEADVPKRTRRGLRAHHCPFGYYSQLYYRHSRE